MTYTVPQANPKAGYLVHKTEILTAIKTVLESGRYILGQELECFEHEFASFVDADYCVGVASGTDALEIALRAYDIGRKDLVFTVSHTSVATVAAIERAGASPFLVDIDPQTFTMDPENLENAVLQAKASSATKHLRPCAIIPVHLYGHPADMESIIKIAQKHDLIVIEDCAQSPGAKFNGRPVGTWGHMAAFSFYPTKNLGAFGDGGAVVTNASKYFEKTRAIREYGWKERYISNSQGINSRLDEIQASLLRVKLRHLEADNRRRIHIARTYKRLLEKTSLQLPQEIGPKICHVYHLYVIRTKNRDRLRAYLHDHGVGSGIHYPVPVHRQPAYGNRIYINSQGLPHTEDACREILSLPIYPELRDDQIAYISTILNSYDNNKM